MDRCDGVETLSKTLRKARQDVRVKGRPHQKVNHHQVQGQDDSLANAMCHETLGPCQERPEDQCYAHRDLNRKIQIRAKTSVSTEKTFHRAHFLIYAGPEHHNRPRSALVDFCLLLFRRYPGLVAGELL